MKTDGAISIWFFIGISLLVNGVLILASGLYELSHPPVSKVVLYELHANVWWGAAAGLWRSILRPLGTVAPAIVGQSINFLHFP